MHISRTPGQGLTFHSNWNSYLHFIGIMCSKFHLDDLKTHCGSSLRYKTFTNRPNNLLITPVYRPNCIRGEHINSAHLRVTTTRTDIKHLTNCKSRTIYTWAYICISFTFSTSPKPPFPSDLITSNSLVSLERPLASQAVIKGFNSSSSASNELSSFSCGAVNEQMMLKEANRCIFLPQNCTCTRRFWDKNGIHIQGDRTSFTRLFTQRLVQQVAFEWTNSCYCKPTWLRLVLSMDLMSDIMVYWFFEELMI